MQASNGPRDSPIVLRAGRRALERIRARGLDAADIGIIPGAAGGPKALGIAGLDRALFGEWLPAKPRVRHLVGASIGAWRFASACCRDPLPVLEAFTRGYTGQRYPRRPSARFVSAAARALLAELFSGREDEILTSPGYRLHILAVLGRGPLKRGAALRTRIGFGMAAMANAVGRRHLARFLDRTLFHDPRGRPAFLEPVALESAEALREIRFDPFRTHTVPLDAGNLPDALLASASIPIVLEGVSDIARAPAGTYWDGGLIDYHLHLPYHRSEDLVLYPHFTDRIVPGWLDKALPWRRARGQWLENVLLVSPSPAYLEGLAHGRLPDRRDFARFVDDFDGRVKAWRTAIAESERLGEAFLDFARHPDPSRILPLQ